MAAISALPAGIAVVEKGRFSYVNPAFSQPIGYGDGEFLLGQPWQILCPASEIVRLQSLFSTLDQSWSGEIQVQLRDGSLRQRRITLTPTDHKLVWLCQEDVPRPVVQQLQTAQQQMEYQARLLQSVVDATDDWIFVKDRDFRFVFVNQGFARAMGKPIETIVGKNDLELGLPEEMVFGNPAEGIRGFRSVDQAVLAGETIHNPYDPSLAEDGSVRIFDTQKMPLRSPEGQVVGIIAICMDITDRRRDQIQLYESQQLLRLVMDTIPQHIFWKNWDLEYLGCNQNFAQAAGLASPEDIVGLNDFDMPWEPEEAEFFRRHDRQVMETGTPEIGTIEPMLRADGKRSWLETSKLPLHDSEGQIIGILGTCQDVTERIEIQDSLTRSEAQLRHKTAELEATLAELRHAQAQMVQTERMSSLGHLVAGIAHEINNPVSFIYGNLKYAREYTDQLLQLMHLYQTYYGDDHPEIQAIIEEVDLGFISQDLLQLLGSMQVGAERIQSIVSSLRAFSHLDEIGLKPINLHQGLDSTLRILERRLQMPAGEHGGIHLIKQYGPMSLVEADGRQLNQVFMNLLSNAIDALESRWSGRLQPWGQTPEPLEVDAENSLLSLPDHPTIRIQTQTVGTDQVQIAIADNGIGIPRHLRSQIFDPFFTTKPVGKGTGMGLSISHQIIAQGHNGRLECSSCQHLGTEFRITLPIRQPRC